MRPVNPAKTRVSAPPTIPETLVPASIAGHASFVSAVAFHLVPLSLVLNP